jgi:O-antigen biosynthesis protein
MTADGNRGLIKLAEVTRQDMDANLRAIAAGKVEKGDQFVATWFLPLVTHALKGGVRTVFMLAQDFSRTWGTLNHFVIYSMSGKEVDTGPLSDSLVEHFPGLRFLIHVHRRGKDDIATIPRSDFAFCTLWTTAYLLLKYNNTRAKYYLMQDFEPSFYPAGGVYGVIEQTYRLGFSCIANTAGVGQRYKQYSDDVVSFQPGVDSAVFHPDESRSSPGQPAHVVFYGRPSNARNCFDLGVETLVALKRRMGDAVRIQSVGEAWLEATYGVEGIVENLGLLGSLEQVANLYRRADLGLVFMMTPHPSYQPLEYMASGCVTATNINESNRWLLNDRNALLVEPLPALAAERIHEVLVDAKKWSAIRTEGLRSVQRLSWESAFRLVRERINNH